MKICDANQITVDNFEGVFKCRKKPITVHAVQINFPEGFTVKTLEGVMLGKPGDYLIIGVDGKKYPCDKEIFEKTYDIVSDTADSNDTVPTLAQLSKDAHRIASAHSFWGSTFNDGEKIALMHSELSEALEALRNDNPRSESISDYSNLEEELADTVIRILDYSYAKGLDIQGAVLAKMKFNEQREHKHGKKF